MKKVVLFTLACCIGMASLFGQKIPAMGIKYQAVLRDASGQVLADQDVSLRIRLLSGDENGKEVYSEFHRVTTTNLGLIALNVGEGKVLAGDFSKIPWSEYNIWMELGLDEQGGNDFVVISASKLLAVPYAFHSGTADALTGGDQGEEKVAAYWKTNGNDASFPGFHFLGTIDNRDLVVKTTNLERMRIYATGNVAINNSLNIGDDLNVADDATIGGDLVINGALTVFDLTVLNNAAIGNDLTVGNDATVTDDLNVGGNAEIDGSASVGTDLTVANDATINNHLTVNGNAEVTGSTDVGTDLGVANDATISNDLNVGGDAIITGLLDANGDAEISGNTLIGSSLSVTDTTFLTGPLYANGGANVSGNTTISSNLSVGGTTTLTGLLDANGGADISGNTAIGSNLTVGGTTTLTGLLDANGGADISGNTAIGSNLTVGGTTTLTGLLDANGGADISGSATIGSNLTVTNNINTTNGDITAGDDLIATDDVSVGDDLTVGGNAVINNLAYIGAGSAPYGNVGLTIRSDYTYSIRSELANGNFLFHLRNDGQGFFSHKDGGSQGTTGSYTLLLENPDQGMFIRINKQNPTADNNFIIFTQLNSGGGTVVAGRIESNGSGGVTYGSGGADYAEYLERESDETPMTYGDIVGVHNGVVSRKTTAANRMMVVTNRPVVLGNMPEDNDESKYEKVGFMGQLPVKVWGKVQAGDYILPSGKEDGSGIARSPEAMQIEDYSRIVGVAWEGSEDNDLKYIHTAIGLNQNDLVKVAASQQAEIAQLKSEQTALQNQYSELLEKVNQLLEKQNNR